MSYCCGYGANEQFLWLPLAVEGIALVAAVGRVITHWRDDESIIRSVAWIEKLVLLAFLSGCLVVSFDLRHAFLECSLLSSEIGPLALGVGVAFERFAGYVSLAMVALLVGMVLKYMKNK